MQSRWARGVQGRGQITRGSGFKSRSWLEVRPRVSADVLWRALGQRWEYWGGRAAGLHAIGANRDNTSPERSLLLGGRPGST